MNVHTGLDQAFGRGVYNATEALRLVNYQRDATADAAGLSRQTLSRWLRGYDFKTGAQRVGHSEPLWKADYADDDLKTFEVSFRDLIELRVVKSFRALGMSLPAIRQCIANAIDILGSPRPFSTNRFKTDGRSIFLDITDKLEGSPMIDLRRRQTVFRAIVAPSLRDLDFLDDAVVGWFPLGRDRAQIVVDPTRSFGRPIVDAGGIPTEVLATAVAVEGSVKRAARLYEVAPAAVVDALEFEQKLAA